MKNFCLNYIMKKIKSKYDYSEEELGITRYGLESLYILITKTIVIFSISIILNIFIEVLIFTLIYNVVRMPSFGLHATKSWICYIFSGLIFIMIPYLCTIITLNAYIRSLLGIIGIVCMYKYAPSDTYKRPIINEKRRNNYKFISTMFAILMVFISLFVNNSFLANCLITSLLTQCIMISPITYKIFKLPYANYRSYQVTG